MVKSKDESDEKKRPERLTSSEVRARAKEQLQAARQQTQRPSSHATHAKTAALLDESSPVQASRSISISSGSPPSSAASSTLSISGSTQSNPGGRPPRFYRCASESVALGRKPQPPNYRPSSSQSQTQPSSSGSSAVSSPQPQSAHPEPLAASELSNDEVAVKDSDNMSADDWAQLLKNYRNKKW